MENKEEIIERLTKESGDFKPKRKFISFISGTSDRIRYNREVAFIDAKDLSSTLEGVKFKITIYKNGTIDFDEVDTNQTDFEMRKRLIESIDDRDITGYTMKYVVAGLSFKDESDKTCYLEVEQKKPIEMLAEIFNEKDDPVAEISISENGMNLLDSLLEQLDNKEEFLESVNEMPEYEQKPILDTNSDSEQNEKQKYTNLYGDMFEKMNQDKINEIKERIEKTSKDINHTKFSIKNDEKKLEKLIEDVKILETRLESFSVKEEPNGFVFFVSEKENKGENLNLTEENREIADKIADIIGLKKDVLFKMLTEGYYTIKIANKDDFSAEKQSVTKDIFEKINSIIKTEANGKIEVISPIEYRYSGSLTWHQLVDKMIKMGFEQNEEFDKLSGSNSYQSNEDDKIEESLQDVKDESVDL